MSKTADPTHRFRPSRTKNPIFQKFLHSPMDIILLFIPYLVYMVLIDTWTFLSTDKGTWVSEEIPMWVNDSSYAALFSFLSYIVLLISLHLIFPTAQKIRKALKKTVFYKKYHSKKNQPCLQNFTNSNLDFLPEELTNIFSVLLYLSSVYFLFLTIYAQEDIEITMYLFDAINSLLLYVGFTVSSTDMLEKEKKNIFHYFFKPFHNLRITPLQMIVVFAVTGIIAFFEAFPYGFAFALVLLAFVILFYSLIKLYKIFFANRLPRPNEPHSQDQQVNAKKSKTADKKALIFWRKIRFALLIAFAILLLFAANTLFLEDGKPASWEKATPLIIALLAAAIFRYFDDLKNFFHLTKGVSSTLERFVLVVLILATGFSSCIYMASGYFESKLNSINIGLYLFSCILQLYFAFDYCKELKDLIEKRRDHTKKMFLVFLILIQIAQFFALSYICIMCVDKTAITFPEHTKISSASELSFEMLYFSVMTLLTVGCELQAVSWLAKILVLIESSIFTIFISLIVFSGFFQNSTQRDKD